MIGFCWLVGMRCRGTVVVFVVWVEAGVDGLGSVRD